MRLLLERGISGFDPEEEKTHGSKTGSVGGGDSGARAPGGGVGGQRGVHVYVVRLPAVQVRPV